MQRFAAHGYYWSHTCRWLAQRRNFGTLRSSRIGCSRHHAPKFRSASNSTASKLTRIPANAGRNRKPNVASVFGRAVPQLLCGLGAAVECCNQFLVRHATADHATDYRVEPISIVARTLVESKRLLIEITKQVKRLDAH